MLQKGPKLYIEVIVGIILHNFKVTVASLYNQNQQQTVQIKNKSKHGHNNHIKLRIGFFRAKYLLYFEYPYKVFGTKSKKPAF